jgi:hypothetical protein
VKGMISGLQPPRLKSRICPTCGHPMPSDEAAGVLAMRQRQLYEIVRASGTEGIGWRDIMSKLYADDPSGGPEGSNIISVMAIEINKKIKPFGVALTARRGPWPLWRIKNIGDITK